MYNAFRKPEFLQTTVEPCIMCSHFKQNNRDVYGLRFGICKKDDIKFRYDDVSFQCDVLVKELSEFKSGVRRNT